MNLRLQQLMAEVDVLKEQARTVSTIERMEAHMLDDELPTLVAFLASSAENLRLLADLQNAMADRYAEAAQLLAG